MPRTIFYDGIVDAVARLSQALVSLCAYTQRTGVHCKSGSHRIALLV